MEEKEKLKVDLEYYQSEYERVRKHREQLRKEYRELQDAQRKLITELDRLRHQVRAGHRRGATGWAESQVAPSSCH